MMCYTNPHLLYLLYFHSVRRGQNLLFPSYDVFIDSPLSYHVKVNASLVHDMTVTF